ncbi:hypothetical protein VP1G_06592 [Cytospora mali]|uniref:WW domain-containing protein n=1 Tax=Cytospora mali TaxID=578113 RepID=A0A194V5W6_CYTMA|nr:hypothetical protein VP1G_06592 [Valsa mali var. pyri (nom. inval.)]
MPSDNEATGANDEVPPVAPQAPQANDDAFSEEGEASDYENPENNSPKEPSPSETSKELSTDTANDAPPLPQEPVPGSEPAGNGAPPLPDEAPPMAQTEDDGWDAMWDATAQAWYFYNRFTGLSQWENPRVPTAAGPSEVSSSATTTAAPPAVAAPTAPTSATVSEPTSVAGGYNPAIHGSWDPNAPYAQAYKQVDAGEGEEWAAFTQYTAEVMEGGVGVDPYAQAAAFNARTGKFQTDDQNPERYSDAAKSQRQMNAYFDVDRAANSHDGKSLKAERRGKQPTKKELAAWKEKRKARKEEKRRAWLRD